MVAPILEHMTALSDQTRCRMLLLLERHELTVSELCSVLQMPQSSVSRHLKTLADDDWVTSRRDGTSRFYSMPVDDLDPGAAQLWPLIREQVVATRGAGQDERRLRGVSERGGARSRRSSSRRRRAGGIGFAAISSATTFYLWAVLGLIDPTLVVGDLGCGTGQLTETVAPYVRRVISVDGSTTCSTPRVAARGARRTSSSGKGELESLPIDDGELDVAMLSLVLHYSPEPPRALAEVGRVVQPGGRVLVVDMLPHEREEYQQQMGHVWLGFSDKQMTRLLHGAGFEHVRVRMLPADPDAKGPALFAAVAVKQ